MEVGRMIMNTVENLIESAEAIAQEIELPVELVEALEQVMSNQELIVKTIVSAQFSIIGCAVGIVLALLIIDTVKTGL